MLPRWLVSLAIVGGLGAQPVAAAELTVSAAASLSNAFSDIARAFEQGHPGNKVVLNFGGSDVLLRQIEHGAPADVFASADEATMDGAAAKRLIDAATRRDFAGNALVVIVGGESAPPSSLGRLTHKSYRHIAIGNPDSVPAGRYAKQALIDAGIWAALLPRLVPTQNVRQALDYVARGEAEAGFVYATDAAVQKDKVRIALTVPTYTPVRYPIAATAGSAHADLARAFVAFVAADAGQAILKNYGFSAAP